MKRTLGRFALALALGFVSRTFKVTCKRLNVNLSTGKASFTKTDLRMVRPE